MAAPEAAVATMLTGIVSYPRACLQHWPYGSDDEGILRAVLDNLPRGMRYILTFTPPESDSIALIKDPWQRWLTHHCAFAILVQKKPFHFGSNLTDRFFIPHTWGRFGHDYHKEAHLPGT